MRVTNSMLISSLLRDLNNGAEKMNKYQEQIITGSRINRPSDDPVGLVHSLRLRTQLTELKQFQNNAEDVKTWLETADSALNESGNILLRVRELTIQGANSAYAQVSFDAIASEIEQLKNQLIEIGNSTYAGKFIFAGTNTLVTAFDNAGNYQGNNGTIMYEVGQGYTIPVNMDGNQAFGNIFTVLDNLIADLHAGDVSSLSGIRLGELDNEINHQLNIRATIGARVNRMDFVINRMQSQNISLTGLLSKTEDADIAQVISELKMQENVYRAALSVGARIVQPTLVDFLR